MSAYTLDKRPLYELLVEADFFVSRFSGAILEALTIGCPVVYYNGHGEKVDKFFDSLGAYEVVEDPEALAAVLTTTKTDKNTRLFLEQHGGFGLGSVSEKTVDQIFQIISENQSDLSNISRFKRSLLS